MSDDAAPRPTVTRLTAPGRGAVATLRFCGEPECVERAGFVAASKRPLAETDVDCIVFGHWGDPPEEVVVCRVADDVVEIHCHGGAAAVGRIEADLVAVGAEIVDARTDLERSSGTLARETRDVLRRATTLRTARIALEQDGGLLRAAVEGVVAAIVGSDVKAAIARVDALLRWQHVGLHLARPWRVVLTGRPNVGKSSLVNALLGYGRSIVYDEPGTTRDVVTAETAFDGWPVSLGDTAGLRDAADELESAGIDRAHEALAAADVRVVLLDVSRPQEPEDARLLEAWPDAIVVAHKCDLPCSWPEEPPGSMMRVSSTEGDGVDDLAAQIVSRLVPTSPPLGTPMPVSERQVELLLRTRDAIVAGDLTDAAEQSGPLLT